MGYRGLFRYKGILISTAVMLVIMLLYGLMSASIDGRASSYGLASDTFSNFQARLNSQPMALSNAQALDDYRTRIQPASELLENDFGPQLTALEGELAAGERAKANALATQIANDAASEWAKKSKLATYINWAAFVLMGLFYLLAVLPQIAKISKDEVVEVESRKEAENILGTVSEGLFLLGRDHEIGVEQSTSLKELFRSKRDLEGNFFDFIGQYVTDGTVSVARDYLDLLYGERVKEKLVKDLNPLNEVEIHIARRDGSYESRFLNFRFNRVLEDDKLSHLLGSVTDVTREVQLARELQETKEEQEAQLDLLMRVLHLDQGSLLKFFDRADNTLKEINSTLESRGHSNDEIRSKIKTISEQAHRVKGDAAALGLHGFEFNMHALETELDKAQATNERLTGRDLLPAVTCLKTAFSELDNMRQIVTRFSEALVAEKAVGEGSGEGADGGSALQIRSAAQGQNALSSTEIPLFTLTDELSERRGVRVHLRTFGLGDDEVPENLKEVVGSTAVQLIRNSVVHGGKPPEERLKQNKADYLSIVVSLTETDKGYSLLVRDDGDGLDEEHILNRAVDLGLITKEVADSKPQGLAQKLIFHSGFSSQAEADLDAGRGVGLNAVYSMVKEHGGTLGLRHSHGRYCQFNLMFSKEQ